MNSQSAAQRGDPSPLTIYIDHEGAEARTANPLVGILDHQGGRIIRRARVHFLRLSMDALYLVKGSLPILNQFQGLKQPRPGAGSAPVAEMPVPEPRGRCGTWRRC